MPSPSPRQTFVTSRPGPRAQLRRHDWIDERSRALGEAIGRHLEREPALLGVALQRLDQWESAARQRGDSRILPALRVWRDVLEHSTVAEVIELLGETSVRAAQLRQSSPFVGVLTEEERAAIFQRFEEL